jgi:hypothetical protein
MIDGPGPPSTTPRMGYHRLVAVATSVFALISMLGMALVVPRALKSLPGERGLSADRVTFASYVMQTVVA